MGPSDCQAVALPLLSHDLIWDVTRVKAPRGVPSRKAIHAGRIVNIEER
jgi:hypothetical protein